MKKALVAIFAIAISAVLVAPVFADTMTARTVAPSKVVAKPSINVTCMQAATEKRDSSILAGVVNYSSTVTSALQTRLTSLKTAWGLEGVDRNKALNKAWDVYKSAVQKARRQMNDIKKTSWTRFYSDLRACRTTDERATAAMDTDI